MGLGVGFFLVGFLTGVFLLVGRVDGVLVTLGVVVLRGVVVVDGDESGMVTGDSVFDSVLTFSVFVLVSVFTFVLSISGVGSGVSSTAGVDSTEGSGVGSVVFELPPKLKPP